MPPKKGRPTSSTRSTTRKRAASRPTPPPDSDVSRCAHTALGFAGVIASSLALSTVLFSLSIPITQGDLAWTSKHLDSWWEVVAFLGWRVVELSIYWVLGYDAIDVAWLNCHVHTPTYVLLANFYNIRPTTVLTVFVINAISMTTPFCLFRAKNPIHATPVASRPSVVRDTPTTIYTTILPTAIYTVVLCVSYSTWIPTFLVTYFDGLPDLRAAHEGARNLVPMALTFLPLGYGNREFLFVSSSGDPHAEELGPEYEEKHGEGLLCSIYRKTWVSLSGKTKTLVSRTSVLAALVMTNTVVQLLGTINGAELMGALGWGGMWTAATVVVAGLYGWIEAA